MESIPRRVTVEGLPGKCVHLYDFAMSSRTSSPFGTLAERSARGKTPFCIVDGVHAGLVLEWIRAAGIWTARVAYLHEGSVTVALLPAHRLAPVEIAEPP